MTIAEAVTKIDALTVELSFTRNLVDDLMRIISSLEVERDDWRARYEAVK